MEDTPSSSEPQIEDDDDNINVYLHKPTGFKKNYDKDS